MCVNVKELCKHIKKSKRSLIWTIENDVHYITNRHWAVKFDELPREVLVSLFSMFAKIPSEGRSLVITPFGDDDERPAVSLEKIYQQTETGIEGTVTNIVLDYGDRTYRVIKTTDFIVRLDNSYMTMVERGTAPVKCSGRMQPVSFGDNQVILLPIRTEDAKEDETIIELLAG